MSARRITTSLAAVGALVALTAPADAASAATYPSISKVSPLQAKIGETLTITGKGFSKGKGKTTVVFYRTGKKQVFATASVTSTTKLTVVVPDKLVPVLGKKNGQPVASRFQLRILAKRFGKKYTTIKASPVIAPAAAPVTVKPAAPAPAPAAAAATPAATPVPGPGPGTPPADTPTNNVDTDGDGIIDVNDPDDDNDLLPDTLERTIGTEPLVMDTDGDGMEDGWEYQSAVDWNRESCPATGGEYPVPCPGAKPYPHKRPYTNPLFADAERDYDNDYLPAGFEYAAWKARGNRSLVNLWYSDGMQASADTSPTDGCRGLVEQVGTGRVLEYNQTGLQATPTDQTAAKTTRWGWLYGRPEYTLDTDVPGAPGYGCLDDSERDEDGDFLSNRVEANGIMSGPDWVQTWWEEPKYKERYGEGTDPIDPDTDGDGLVDGLDDEDGDDFWNVEEIRRGTKSAKKDESSTPSLTPWIDTEVRTGLWVDPYNSCLPAIYSGKCARVILAEGDTWRPFYDPRDGEGPKFWPYPRWPMFHTAVYEGDTTKTAGVEIWRGTVGTPVSPAQQILPLRQPGKPGPGLEHPLLPRPE